MRLRATLLRPSGGLRPLASIIKGFFANGEQGVWYDPSDLTTLYQDAAGTIPVTAVEQPVGLMLDKSRGLVLGPELVKNGDFSQGATGWGAGANASMSLTNGELLITSPGQMVFTVNNAVYTSVVGHFAGRRYQIDFDATYVSGADLQAGVSNTVGITISAAENGGVKKRYSKQVSEFTATSSRTICFASASLATATWRIDNISVRELPGNHASQTTATSRPVLSARVNLLTKTEDFSNGVWQKLACSVSLNVVTAPDGTLTAGKIVASVSADTSAHYLAQNFSFSAGTYKRTFYAKAGEKQGVYCSIGGVAWGCFNLLTGTVNGVGATNTLHTNVSATIADVGNGWYRCSVTSTLTDVSTTAIRIGPCDATYVGPQQGFAGDGVSGIYIWGADLRPANTGTNLPDYQRVNTSTDYDTAGFPRIEWFDAVDDVQNVTFPVSLGSNCTVARVAQGGAVTILTGQTIGTSYQINQSHAGLIVVNRALTQSETSAVTRYLQRKGIGQ